MPKRGGAAWAEPDQDELPTHSPENSEDEEDKAKKKHMKYDMSDLVADKKEREEEEKKKVEYIRDKQAEQEGGVKAVQMMKALKGTDPNKFTGLRKTAHQWISWWGFDTLIGVIIMLNAVTIGIETQIKTTVPIGCTSDCNCDNVIASDKGKECHLPPDWISVADYIFLGIYTLELTARFVVYGPTVLRSHWVKFDLILVIAGLADILLKVIAPNDEYLKKLMLVRMLRLGRLARALRLMVQFQTLWQLVQGLLHSVPTLLWTFLLVMILIYISAVVGMELIKVDPNLPLDDPYNVAAGDNFGDFMNAIMTLLQIFSFDSIGGIYRPLIKHQPAIFIYFMIVILLLSIALMNLVTAVMVNSSLDQASEDKEAKKSWEEAKKKKQMEQLKIMFLELDEDGSGELSLDEIEGSPPEAQEQLQEIAGTDNLKELFEMLDYDGGGTVGVDEFCEGVLKATSSAPGTMELGRLVKQCADILKNSRETVSILSDPEKGFKEFAKSGASGGGGGGGGGGADLEDLTRLDKKVGKMENDLGRVHADISRILSMVNDRLSHTKSKNSTNSLARTGNSHSPTRSHMGKTM